MRLMLLFFCLFSWVFLIKCCKRNDNIGGYNIVRAFNIPENTKHLIKIYRKRAQMLLTFFFLNSTSLNSVVNWNPISKNLVDLAELLSILRNQVDLRYNFSLYIMWSDCISVTCQVLCSILLEYIFYYIIFFLEWPHSCSAVACYIC